MPRSSKYSAGQHQATVHCPQSTGMPAHVGSGITAHIHRNTQANVSLQKIERTDKLGFILKNETDHSIYVSYLPPEQGNTAKFLSYGLERKTATGDFKPYGEGFHFVPSLTPLASKSAIEFTVIYPPKETGAYRVIVGYYEDEAAFRLITEKGSNLTDSEKKEVDGQQRIVRSDPFAVR